MNRYSAILVPSPIDPTENQQRAIRQFVRSGGTLVCQEPERLGIDLELEPADRPYLAGSGSLGKGRVLQLAGEVTPTWTHDVGAEFFKRYDADLRDQIHDLAEAVGVAPILEESQTALVGAFPAVQPDRRRVVVHLVNYDVDRAKDSVREKTDVVVKLPVTMFEDGQLQAEVWTPDAADPRPVPLDRSGGIVSCTVPRLGGAATLAIRAE